MPFIVWVWVGVGENDNMGIGAADTFSRYGFRGAGDVAYGDLRRGRLRYVYMKKAVDVKSGYDG